MGDAHQDFPIDGRISLRELALDDYDQLVEVHKAVIRSLPASELFRDADEGFLRSLIGPDASCFGIFDGDVLIAYSAVRFPVPGSLSLAKSLGIPQEDAIIVAEFEGVAVLPQFRGKGYQWLLTEARAAKSLWRGRPFTVASVSPRNLYSLKNFLAYGMTGRGFSRLYGGLERIIVARNHISEDSPMWEHHTRVPRDDIAELLRALDKGLELRAICGEGNSDFLFGKRRQRLGNNHATRRLDALASFVSRCPR